MQKMTISYWTWHHIALHVGVPMFSWKMKKMTSLVDVHPRKKPRIHGGCREFTHIGTHLGCVYIKGNGIAIVTLLTLW